MDFDALALQFGGNSASPSGVSNLDDLAQKFGGSAAPAPAPSKLDQLANQFGGRPQVDTNQPPPYKDRAEAVADIINLLEEGADREKIRAAAEQNGIKWGEIVAAGQKRGSSYFKPQKDAPTAVNKGPYQEYGAIKSDDDPAMLDPNKDILTNAINTLGGLAVGTKRAAIRAQESGKQAITGAMFNAGVMSPAQAAKEFAAISKRQQANKGDAETQRQIEAMEDGGKDFLDYPAKFIANPRGLVSMVTDASILSAATAIPTMLTNMSGVGAAGRMATQGTVSGAMEFGSAVSDTLDDMGVNMLNPVEVEEALKNPKVIARIREVAINRGAFVGAADAATAGIAGNFLRPVLKAVEAGKLGGKTAQRAAAKAWAKEFGVQIAGGMGGEKLAQMAAGQNKNLDVWLEGIAEVPGSLHEIHSGAHNVRNIEAVAKQQAEVQNYLNDLLKPGQFNSVEEVTKRLQAFGLPEEDAQRMAEARIQKERETEAKLEREGIQKENEQERIDQPPLPPTEQDLKPTTADQANPTLTPIERAAQAGQTEATTAAPAPATAPAKTAAQAAEDELTGELVDQGLSKDEARVQARLILAREVPSANTQANTQGEANAARPNAAATGRGAEVPAQSTLDFSPAQRVEGVERNGVVPAESDAGRAASGEREQSAPVVQTITAEPEAPKQRFTVEQRAEQQANGTTFFWDLRDNESGKVVDTYPSSTMAEEAAKNSNESVAQSRPTPAPEATTAEVIADEGKKAVAAQKEEGSNNLAVTQKEAYEAGVKAAKEGKDLSRNPYTDNDTQKEQGEAWALGHLNTSSPIDIGPINDLRAKDRAERARAESFARSQANYALDYASDPATRQQEIDYGRDNVTDTLNSWGLSHQMDAAYTAYEQEIANRTGTQATPTETNTRVDASKDTTTTTEASAEQKSTRGRKPVELTEEQRAAKEAAAKADRAQRGRHNRALTKLTAQLESATAPIDEANYANDEEVKQAEIDKRQARRSAIRGLVQIMDEAGGRNGKPAGRKAFQALTNAKVTQQELADIRRGIEATKKTAEQGKNNYGPVSSRQGSDVGKADPRFGRFNTGMQAIGHIIRTGNAFQRFMGMRIRNALRGVNFVVIEKGEALPVELQSGANAKAWERARAMYVYGNRTVYIRGASFGKDLQGSNHMTVLHELLHAATHAKIEAAKALFMKGDTRSGLVQAYTRLLDAMENAQAHFNDLNDARLIPPEMATLIRSTDLNILYDPHEFVAYGMSDPDFQEFLMTAEGDDQHPSLFSKFVRAIAKFFGVPPHFSSAMMDLVIATDSILSAKIPRGFNAEIEGGPLLTRAERANLPLKEAQEQLNKDETEALKKVSASVARGNFTVAAHRKAWESANYTSRQVMVALPPMDMLADWAVDAGIPRIMDVHKHLQAMNGMSTSFLKGANNIIQATRNVFNNHPNERTAIAELMYASTLAEYDPSKPGGEKGAYAVQLEKQYNALSDDGKRLFQTVREYYSEVREYYRQLLDDQINNLTGVNDEVKKNLLATIKQNFEGKDFIDPFFPLVRYGDFWVSADISGEGRQVFMFESIAERNGYIKELIRNGAKNITAGNDPRELRLSTQNSSELLTKMFDAIDAQFSRQAETGVVGELKDKEALKDSIYQLYLQTLPEQSFRNMFIHRKGRAGFSTDLLRNMASTASRMSRQLAKIKYGQMLRNDISMAADSIKERPELTPYVEEARRRVSLALSGQHGGILDAVAGVANKASFIWYMTGGASAMLQPFSVVITGLPVIAANHGGSWLGASRELSKTMTMLQKFTTERKNAVDGSTSWTAPTLVGSEKLTADEQRALRLMTDKGVEESTYASAVFNYSRTPSADIDSMWGKTKDIGNTLVGGAMHNMERLSREIVYLSSYRLSRKQGLTFEQAVDQAVADVNESLGDYDQSNRPRWMQSGLGKVLNQFKMYPIHMLGMMLTNFKRMIAPLDGQSRAVAAQKFFGMAATSFLIGGAANTMLFSPLLAVLGAAWKNLKDDDWPDELRDMDFPTWFRTVLLPNVLKGRTFPGTDKPMVDVVDRGLVNAATGWDVGSRAGLNDITNLVFGRDGKEVKTARDKVLAWLIDNYGGPTLSLGLSMADAYQAYIEGDKQRALEKALPSGLRNILIALRYYNEGVKDTKGAELFPKEGPDSLTKGEILGQAIGFRPDRVAFAQSMAFKQTGNEQRIAYEHDLIMRRLNTALRNQDWDGMAKIFSEEVPDFNKRHPGHELKNDDIDNSLKQQTERRGSARAGFNVTEKNAGWSLPTVQHVEDTIYPSRAKAIREAQQKGKGQ